MDGDWASGSPRPGLRISEEEDITLGNFDAQSLSVSVDNLEAWTRQRRSIRTHSWRRWSAGKLTLRLCPARA